MPSSTLFFFCLLLSCFLCSLRNFAETWLHACFQYRRRLLLLGAGDCLSALKPGWRLTFFLLLLPVMLVTNRCRKSALRGVLGHNVSAQRYHNCCERKLLLPHFDCRYGKAVVSLSCNVSKADFNRTKTKIVHMQYYARTKHVSSPLRRRTFFLVQCA